MQTSKKKGVSRKGPRGPTGRFVSASSKLAMGKSIRKQASVANAARGYTGKDPKLLQTSADSIKISHREFIQDVTGQTAFTALSFPINPGRDVLFTWLPDLATRYERYQFTRLRFLYEPRCSTATAGSIILAVDYDPLDPAPVNKQDVYAYHHPAQSSAWDESLLTVDSSIMANRGTLYVRPGTIPATADLKTYDLGNLWLCVSGFAGPTVCGELFVEYEVVLKIPQVQSNVQAGTLLGATGVDVTHQLGTNYTSVLGLLDATVTPTTITFNQNWTGVIVWYGSGTVISAVGSTGTATSAIYNPLVINAAATNAMVTFYVTALRGQTFVPLFVATTFGGYQMELFPVV